MLYYILPSTEVGKGITDDAIIELLAPANAIIKKAHYYIYNLILQTLKDMLIVTRFKNCTKQ